MMLMCLDKTRNQGFKDHVKTIARECTLHNRKGDPAFVPLLDTLETYLDVAAGEECWFRT